MIIGRLQTRNYEWVTLTNTVPEALENLKRSWEAHAEGNPEFWRWEDLEDSVTMEPLNLGDTLTDCLQCENLAHTLTCENCGDALEGELCPDCDRCRCHGELNCTIENQLKG